jgi:predicted amidohydrolase
VRVRLAAYQGYSVRGDVDANVATARRAIAQAREERADFLCLPETFLSGYGDRETVERAAILSDDARLAELGRLAGEREMVLLVGFSERLEDGGVGNSVAIFDGERRLGTYRKTMLTGGDYREMGFCRDFELPVWEAKGITFGCIVCADSTYFETAATMAYGGASVLFSPHYNCIAPDRMDAHRVRVRNNHVGLAALLEMHVVRANVVHRDDPRGLGYGDSAIFGPDGAPLAEAGLFRERLIVAEAEISAERAAGRSRLRERVPREVRRRLSAVMEEHAEAKW